ncbi:relaxase/mobilization nuclease [Streptomyces sp. NPDC017202]|uniref:relaxase/mobilization nuclease n=1 Tax=Streptomyces sp. NPDC017202 TaxID=3364981 RepID=UPI0037A37FA1
MIPRLHERTHRSHGPLEEALGRPVSPNEGLTDHTVVAHWPGLDHFTLDDEQKTWTATQWAEHLEDPYLEHPFAASPDNDRQAILHVDVRLHPQDRDLFPVRTGHSAIPAAPTASAQLARVLTQLAEEQAGPLATVRGLIEHTAHRLERQPGPAGAEAAHGLELIARRLHAIQQDLDTTAARLVQPRTAALPPPARRSAHRSP